MLQIISGKFFKNEDLHIHQGRGILYSNYFWFQPIETSVATLEPVLTYKQEPVTAYVISYLNKIEKGETIVRTGDPEIVHQFQLLGLFGLRAFFAVDKNSIEINCK